jgi:hypothetical protein
VGFYSLNLDTMFQHFPYCFVLNNRKLHDEKHCNLLNTFCDANNPVDKIINSQIDEYHDNAKFNPKESLKKLKKIEQGNFDDIPNKTKYRLLVNIAVAYGRQNKEQELLASSLTNVLFSWSNFPKLRNEKFNEKSILFTVYYY